ncbi:NitT/TauT family transport system substrate-binding protein [Nonomuraea fuscirosea]|uniref:NitT/TauT family transport system substrate-binding protein n=1 Tax=Nonomuraea fuscirosea TaxID=1291556 RepID=A0A2T0LXT6_9ACTN|nr:NitT/TauT family transport system substrate-binding protein [Nonomuraea fuscirosea]
MKRLLSVTLSALCVIAIGCAPPSSITAPRSTGICGPNTAPASSATTDAAREPVSLQVAIISIPDVAPAKLAEHCGFFATEGLKIRWTEIRGSADAVPGLASGDTHVALWNYVTGYAVEDRQPGLARLIADAYQAENECFLLMVRRDSPIQSLADLKWNGTGKKKTIGVGTFKSVSTLTAESTLRIAGVTADDIKFVQVPLPQMAAAVQAGRVDMGWMTEPGITLYKTKYGARVLADVATAGTSQWPIAGWAVSTKWADAHPDLVVRFQRALARGQELAAQDDSTVRKILPSYALGIDDKLVGAIKLGSFPTTLNPTRLQRVADAMLEASKGKAEADKYLTKPIDVTDLLWQAPGSASTFPFSSPGVTP